MKKLAHYLELRTLKYPTEDSSKVKKAIQNTLNLEQEELQENLQKQKTESQHGSNITKYAYKTKRWSEVKKTIKRISRRTEISRDLEKHLNSEGDFYIRLDKQQAYKGNLKTAESGDVIHLKVKIASYPFKIDQVKENLRELIKEEEKNE